ncbi:MAG: filamentous hemagglutinin N-terminal domain-containing protein [Okeania sp. SIO3B5]|uniref:two-partner secretion domain-containing protein n=1 Tax=Okeania sp. SIO3B5 TaxID=2607811 RepID=UPI0013FFDC0D|nr:ShlB/FhaC/HecB family hemolysin secretion/activation protein [Okeania sp. SIO3B5]NEO55311.1 filamentous hemagglutinin N-terminal domain-containing protein [Okeania sp. SIO3B5]
MYLTLGYGGLCISPAIAQLQPDSTLGEEKSVVTPNINIKGIESDRIDGGTQRGANLFHSFQEFNIQQGRGVYFTNPDGVANILTRITGNNISNILGTLGVLGNANLFFINPNGIIFGPDAKLDIGGSFYGATANSILFANGFEFATSDPQAPPLLTVNVPIGLRLPENPGNIQVEGKGHNLSFDPNTFSYIRENRNAGLQVAPSQTLALIGGDIFLRGGNLTSEGGRIELGSVQGGVVGITNSASALNYEEIPVFGIIQLSQASSLDVSGEGAGNFQIQSRHFEIRDGSRILANTLAGEDGDTSTIRASELIEILGTTPDSEIFSGITVEVAEGGTGKGGNLIMETKNLRLRERGEISVSTLGEGTGGDLTISATDVELVGGPADLFARNRNTTIISGIVKLGGEGNAGNIRIQTESLRVLDGAQISSTTFGQGKGGNLTISATDIELIGTSDDFPSGLFALVVPPELAVKGAMKLEKMGNGGSVRVETENLRLQDGAEISSSTFGQGNAGNLIISAKNIEIIGAETSASSLISVVAKPEAEGNGGNLKLETENLLIRDGGQISTLTRGQGNAGNLTISAKNIELTGTTADERFPSALFSSVATPEAKGNGGIIRLEAETLRLQDGAQIATGTRSQGDGGDLIISAKNIELIGTGTTAEGEEFPSGLFSSVARVEAKGNAGTMILETETLRIQDGAKIGVDTFGQGDGGDLTISATDITLIGTSADDRRLSEITASVQEEAIGDGGNITLNTTNLQIQNGARITASTSGQGNAGDITISAKNLEIIGTSAGQTPSRLTAEATDKGTGAGGTLIINTENFKIRDEAEITVSSQTQKPAGNLEINSNNILVENQGSLNAETTAGQGSIIINNNKDFILRNNSNITTNATGAATGGNIEINTENLVALENSDISANAQAAFGGRINITAAGIFGTEFRPQQTNNSDITATSELGASFSGEVNLNTPEVDPSDGLVQFDDTIEDISALIDQNPCQRGEGSEFTITGQGGLPPSPRDFLTPHNISQEETPATPENIVIPSEPEFIEAQGWESTPNGIQLIVNPNTVIPVRPWLTPPNCEKINSQQLQPYLLASTTDIIPSSNSQSLQVTIQQFNFQGNTKFSNQELQQQLTPYLNKPIAFDQLIAARTAITEYYTKNNYITSGAFIPPQTVTENGVVTIQVVEGKIDEIDIKIEGRLNENYIKSRLEKATIAPINQDKLLSALQLLQLDPLIDNISAELSAGVRPDTSVLEVEVVTANPWRIAAISNNGRVPSVGTFRRGIEVGHGNLTGMGDSFNTLYTNTDGSDLVELSYAIPVNSRNGRIEMFYRYQDNEVIESPFERLDIQSNSRTYKLAFRQPIIQTPRQEFSVGVSATRRDSQTSVLGENFPLSAGANDDGETKLSILQFFQDYQLRGDNQVLALNSQFNIGLGILDATVNSDEPDSRFFYWRGQGQWVRELATDTLLVVGADVQLSPSELVPLERFGLGGYRSVRGYRQDTRLTDNGALGTVELRLPVPWISGENRLFQVVPFIDGGVAWNSYGEEVSGTNALAAVGVGLQVKLWNKINMRLDYGIPLIDVDSRDRTAQEDGFYFSVSSSPFSF